VLGFLRETPEVHRIPVPEMRVVTKFWAQYLWSARGD
jgi:hypothetical protein